MTRTEVFDILKHLGFEEGDTERDYKIKTIFNKNGCDPVWVDELCVHVKHQGNEFQYYLSPKEKFLEFLHLHFEWVNNDILFQNNGTVTLLNVHPKAIEYYGDQEKVVKEAKGLSFPLEVDFYCKSPHRSISEIKLQYFTDSIIEEIDSRDEDDDRPNTWNLSWFVTDNDEINAYSNQYWDNIT